MGTTSSGAGQQSISINSSSSGSNGYGHGHGYTLMRHPHSAGEVTCVCIDQFVSLPANAQLSVHFTSQADPLNTTANLTGAGAVAQPQPQSARNVKGFLSISKL